MKTTSAEYQRARKARNSAAYRARNPEKARLTRLLADRKRRAALKAQPVKETEEKPLTERFAAWRAKKNK